MNSISKVFDERCINKKQFAKANGIIPATLYSALSDNRDWHRVSVDVFIRIAEGLGMTAEELYALAMKYEGQEDGEE